MAIKAKLLPRWPAAINGVEPIVATKANGAVTLSYDSSGLPQVSSPTSNGRIVVREGDVYNEVPALNVAFPTIANNTLVGNNSGSTAAPSALTGAQTNVILPAFTGDSGSGGVKGLVPAPSAGDAAAGRYLDSDGTWSVPSGAVSSVAGRTGAVTLDGTDVSFTQSGTGAITETITARLREQASVFDFMTTAQIADVQANTATLDHTTAVQAAITAATRKRLFWPAGTYSCTALTGVSNTIWEGAGPLATIIKKRGAVAGDLVSFYPSASYFSITDIQFDGGDISNATAYANLTIRNSAVWSVERCRFVKFDKIGLAVNAGTNGYINNNYFFKTTADMQGVNQSILIGTSAGASNNIVVSNNFCQNSGIISVGPNIWFLNNYITGWKYGAGISNSIDGASDYNVIIGNYCQSGTGIDSDGFTLKGIEAWGRYGKIIGNNCVSNSGPGIWVGGQFTVVEGNFCLNNNTYNETVSGGILAAYFDATNNAQNAMISNNVCWDSAGAGGTQNCGVAIDYRNDQIHVVDNQCHQNKTQQYFVYNGVSAAENTAITFRGRTYTKSFVWDAASIANGASLTNAQTVAYANLTDFVQASCSISQAGLTLSAYVSGANTVVVVLTNNTGGAVDLASATFRVFGQQSLY